VRDLTQPLQECLTALDQKRNLQEVLRRYPADRDELISLLRLSVDLSTLGPPPADPGFRLRARNQMLAAAADRRRSRRWNPLASLPRPAARLAFAGALAAALALGGLTAAEIAETIRLPDSLEGAWHGRGYYGRGYYGGGYGYPYGGYAYPYSYSYPFGYGWGGW